MHPISTEASSDVLTCRDGQSAAFASLTSSTRPDAVRRQGCSFLLAEPGWAQGCHRKPEASRAELLQVRRAYPRADLCPLRLAHTSSTHEMPQEIKRARRCRDMTSLKEISPTSITSGQQRHDRMLLERCADGCSSHGSRALRDVVKEPVNVAVAGPFCPQAGLLFCLPQGREQPTVDVSGVCAVHDAPGTQTVCGAGNRRTLDHEE